jgi:putative ABC transport system substrate-binding protein
MIPIVFATGADAIQTGLVTSLSRPEANVTGLSFNQTGLVPKRMELARELLPGSGLIAYLENPANGADSNRSEIEATAQTLARQLILLKATTVAEIIAAFEAMVKQRVAVLVLSADAALNAHRDLIIELAARHAIPTIYSNREYVQAGGLMSYGVELSDLYRWAGVYAGRILKGDKPADLPVMLPTKYELVINNKTAKTLGIKVPLSLLIRVDEVIE